MSHYVKVYAPAVVLALCAAWVGLVSSSRVSATVWLVVLACAVVVQVREIRACKRRGRR